MMWKLYLTTFCAVFVAELADKTQVVGMSLAAESRNPVMVWLGSVSAYMIITAITVILGGMLGGYLKPDMVRYASGSIFVIIGILVLWGKV